MSALLTLIHKMEEILVGQTGKIWLAGAGPGDARLLTIKTRELMEEADVIVYDALISTEILSLIPADTRMIHVGKRAGAHRVSQEEINEILVEQAKQGKKVLRLKGGDPFVFGRGGEELEEIVKEGIPFEVVPGIPSAVAVPAYAGIPVTHRDHTSSFHVITGHGKQEGSKDVDFETLVRLNATLVFLMGMNRLSYICQGLLEAGMPFDMPAAVLSRGTTAAQQSVISTVGKLCQDVKQAQLLTPAVIVVGQVCAYSREFGWYKDLPLGGRQILVTRPRQNSLVLAKKLRELGAQVIELPSIITRPIQPNLRFTEAVERIGKEGYEEEWLVFTSPVGVSVFFEQLKEQKLDIRKIFGSPAVIKAAAIGRATEKALAEHGILADVTPQDYCARELGRVLARAAKRNSYITVIRAKEGSEELLPPLYEAGLDVDDVPIYETGYESHEEIKGQVQSLLERGEIHWVTFTSASTVEGFVRTFEGLDHKTVHAICIGDRTAKAARNYGMQVEIAQEASMDSMIDLMLSEV